MSKTLSTTLSHEVSIIVTRGCTLDNCSRNYESLVTAIKPKLFVLICQMRYSRVQSYLGLIYQEPLLFGEICRLGEVFRDGVSCLTLLEVSDTTPKHRIELFWYI